MHHNFPSKTGSIIIQPDDTTARALLQPLLIGLILLLLPLIFQSFNAHSYFQKTCSLIQSIQADNHGTELAVVIYLLAGGLLISLGIPRLWISAGAGAIFSPLLGTAIALASSLMGAAILYQTGRCLLSRRRHLFLEKRLGRYQRHFQQRAFIWVLYARLFPFSNSTIVSLFSGYSRIDFSQYLAGSLIGFTPLTIVMCLFGSGGTQGKTLHLLTGFGLIALLHLLMVTVKKRLSMSENTYRKNND